MKDAALVASAARPAIPTPKDLFGLLTVETLCDLVESRLAGPGA